jgi:glycerol kinase
MAANTWLLQALADITAVPVERPAMIETTVIGAAFLAGLGVGLFPSLAAIESAWRRALRTEPAMDSAQRAARLSGWAKAVAQTRGLPSRH